MVYLRNEENCPGEIYAGSGVMSAARCHRSEPVFGPLPEEHARGGDLDAERAKRGRRE